MISEAQRDEYGNLKGKQSKPANAAAIENGLTDGQKKGQLAMPTLMRIMEDVFISSIDWLR